MLVTINGLPGKINLVDSDKAWMPTQFGINLAELLVDHHKRMSPLGSMALELGTGTGIQCCVLGKLGYHVTGIDLNQAALDDTNASWRLNHLPPNGLTLIRSNLFHSLNGVHGEAFDLLVSNPPTFPGNVPVCKTVQDWEYAGTNGRLVLDAVIRDGRRYLAPGGVMYTIATSKQGWCRTRQLMDLHWGSTNWEVARWIEIPLAEHYAPFIPQWLELEHIDGEPRIYSGPNGWYQRLYFIRARKVLSMDELFPEGEV